MVGELINPYMEIDNEAVRARVAQTIELRADGVQRAFSEMTGIEESILSKLLRPNTKRHFLEIHLRAIEQKTHTRLEWLLYGEEPMRWAIGQIPDRPPLRHEGQMLRAYLDRHGPSDTELGARLNKAKSTVSKYFDSASFESDTRQAILKALDATYEDVFGDGLTSSAKSAVQRVRLGERSVSIVKIPLYARAGIGYVAFFSGPLTEREYVDVHPDKLYQGVKADNHAVVVVNGDSMEPELKAGYEMLAYELKNGSLPSINKIVLVDFRDELTIKRLAAVDWVHHTITLRSDNGGAEMRLPMAEIRRIWHVYDYHKARL